MRQRTAALACAALALVAAAAWLGHAGGLRTGLGALRDGASHRLDLVAAGVDTEVARFDTLPSLLEMTPNVFDLLDAPEDKQLAAEVNRFLRGINATAGAEMLYVLDRSGTARAAADWDQPGTPFGRDLSFRPYVQDALARGRGQFYGVGITSGRPGYYLSFALSRQGRQRGVATVKVSLEGLEQAWRKLPGEVLLADARGVLILSTREAWRFRPLAPLSALAQAEIVATRPYGNAALLPVSWQVRSALGDDARLVEVERQPYLATERALNHGQWRLIVLDDLAPARATARNAALIAGLSAAVLLLALTAITQRQRSLRQKLASRAALQAAHDGLEAKVTERTAELQSANERLAGEVELRRAIEADLRATQNELVHAGKMAALGQMSAGIVHELNQPLAAMRTLSDNACVLLEHDRRDDVRGNLKRIAHLVDRVGRLTQQLKVFAHKTAAPPIPVSVATAVANAQFMLSARLRDTGVQVELRIDPPALMALADEARLEQVLVNLIGNAIDAMAAAPQRHLRIEARAVDGECLIRVADTGPGIRADILPRLFEPFATTKPAGAGLGLGLMISAHLLRESAGSLAAGNPPEGGARFDIRLPLANLPANPAPTPPKTPPSTAPAHPTGAPPHA